MLTRRAALLGPLFFGLMSTAGALSQGAGSPFARRVVSLDLFFTEILLSLGVSPLAVANIPLYWRLVAEPALQSDTVDLGPLAEPNLEYLQHLKPDLILGASWQSIALARVGEIAPALWLANAVRGKPALEHVFAIMETIGDKVGKLEEARAWRGRTEAALATSRQKLMGYDGRPLFVVRFMEDARHAAIFRGGMVGDVLDRLGLVNAWHGNTNASGVATIGIEQLMGTPDARIVHFHRGPETERALKRLDQSAFWRALPAVKDGRIQVMPVIYPNGAAATAVRFADQLAAGLLDPGHG